MTTDDTTPQQRLDANPELLEQVTEAMEHPERGVPRPERRPSAYDVVPPELRPHRW